MKIKQESDNENNTDKNENNAVDSYSENLVVVGIGASAGGLEALKALFPSLPVNRNIAFIVAQHLDPQHRSLLTELLTPSTHLNVREAEDGEEVKHGNIYIVPPARNAELIDGHIKLTESSTLLRPKPSVDLLFSSMAEQMGERAAGIILSGTGTDGSAGIRAIKAGGGFTLVQDPELAKFDGMPRSAIDTGHVDLILAAEKMGAELPALLRFPREVPKQEEGDKSEDAIQRILRLLRMRTGVDFSEYKINTVERRLMRRMTVHKLETLGEYLSSIEHSYTELDALFQDILISVTAFFRDCDAFRALEKPLAALLDNKHPGDEIRIWVPGCASGEEAYTMAILIDRMLGAQITDYRVQVFATDLDEPAIIEARRAQYPASSLIEIDRNIIESYFTPSGNSFQVRKHIREMVVFARHNLVSDPPFLRMDLISCRNLLIYFGTKLQQRILPMFHYALNPRGILFLGKSETVGEFSSMFSTLHNRWRIYARNGESSPAQEQLRDFTSFTTQEKEIAPARKKQLRRHAWQDSINRVIADAWDVPGVIVDDQLRLLQVRGDITPWLSIPVGNHNFDLINMVREELSFDIRTLLHRVRKSGRPVNGNPRRIHENDKVIDIQLSAHAIPPNEDGRVFYLVLFHATSYTSESNQPDMHVDENRVSELEHELATTQEHLQTTVEELETTNEELQSLNEELQSTNEELQSSNEELQSSNEELQSTNEELTTVNDELINKTAELTKQHTVLENVFSSIDYPFIVVDRNLRLTHFSKAVNEIFGTTPQIEERITSIPLIADLPHLKSDIQSTIDKGNISERVVDMGEFIFLQHLSPFRSANQEILGAILIFQDQTELRQMQRLLSESEERAVRIIQNAPQAMLITDENGIITQINNLAERLFGYTHEELVGHHIEQLIPISLREKHIQDRKAYFKNPEARPMGIGRDLQGLKKDGSLIALEISLSPIIKDTGTEVVIAVVDISDRKLVEENLIYARLEAERLSQVKGEFLANMSHELRTPMHAILSFSAMALKRTENAKQKRFIENIRTSSIRLTALLDDLLDLSKLEAGKMEPDFHMQDIGILIQQALTEVSSLLFRKNIKISFDSKEQYECMVDQKMSIQIFVNLLSNAIKFSPEYSTLNVELNAYDQEFSTIKRSFIRIVFTDSGIGIPEEEVQTIFDKFAQSSKSRNHKGGTGLGLAICKQLVDVHNGKIWAESPPSGQDTGTAIYVDLPVLQGEANQIQFTNLSDAISSHIEWIKVLDDMHDNKEECCDVHASFMANENLCSLGQWINSNKFKTQTLEELNELHKDFHFLAGECIAYCEMRDFSKSEEKLKQFHLISDKLIELLKDVELSESALKT